MVIVSYALLPGTFPYYYLIHRRVLSLKWMKTVCLGQAAPVYQIKNICVSDFLTLRKQSSILNVQLYVKQKEYNKK